MDAQSFLYYHLNISYPAAMKYGQRKTLDANRSILHPNLETIQHQQQVQVVCNRFVISDEGLENITLKHPHHRTFHKFPFWRPSHPYAVLSLAYRCRVIRLESPSDDLTRGKKQVLRYIDGWNQELQVPLVPPRSSVGMRGMNV